MNELSMIENCILIFGIVGSIALYFIFWMLFIVADELRGIRDAVSGAKIKSTSEEYIQMALEMALPLHGKKPGIDGHFVFTKEGRFPVYRMTLTEQCQDKGYYILATSDSDQLLAVVYEWNQLVEGVLKKEAEGEKN